MLNGIDKDIILSDNYDKVIYEGELLKFSPGIKENHYVKWVQLTCKEFRYYKDRFSAVGHTDHPLIIVPLSQIDKVERVSVKISSPRSTRTPYQFEIFLKDSNSGQEYKETKLPKNNVQQSFQSMYNSQLRRSALAFGMSIKSKKEYFDYVNNNAKILSKVVMEEELKGNTEVTGNSGPDTWSNRAYIWEQLKERHIYAHEEKLECEKWVFILNWILDILKEA